MRWLLWLLAKLIAWLIAPFALYLTAALFGAMIPWKHEPHGPQTPDHRILLAVGPIHYDILLPLTDETRSAFAFLEEAGVPVSDAGSQWLSIGWGSEAFYTSTEDYNDMSFATVWKAVTGDSAVLRFETYGALGVHPQLRPIWIGGDQFETLKLDILDHVQDPSAPLPISGFSETDVFYTSAGRFNLFNTCNVWAADRLAEAGLAMGFWTPTPYAVTLSLWWNGHLGD